MADTQLKLEDAEQVLLRDVAHPAFLQKLASYGIEPANADEFADMDAMATQLYANHMQRQEQQRTASRPLVKAAFAAMFGQTPSPQQRPVNFQAAAKECLKQEPQVKQAALAYFNHLSAQAA